MLHNLACLQPTPDNLIYPPNRGDYTYFEGLRHIPGRSFLVNAAWAMDASMLAYARYGRTRMTEEELSAILHDAGFTNVDTFGDNFVDNACTARGFFASNDERGLLVFRGTEGDDPNDKEADFDFVFVEDDGTRVERGFYRYVRTVWWYVSRLVAAYRRDHPTQEICVTGHSLGGALASLAFAYLRDPATSLYTFGCPRVGDRAFCGRIEAAARTQQCYRFIDNQDVVTHVPTNVPVFFPYEHPKTSLVWFDANGKMTTDEPAAPSDWAEFAQVIFGYMHGHILDSLPNPLPLPLADHSPVRYCYWIGEALQNRAPQNENPQA
jgi:triacylglycerol lipase